MTWIPSCNDNNNSKDTKKIHHKATNIMSQKWHTVLANDMHIKMLYGFEQT